MSVCKNHHFTVLVLRYSPLKMEADQAWCSAEARDYHKFQSLSQLQQKRRTLRGDRVCSSSHSLLLPKEKDLGGERRMETSVFSGFGSMWWLVTIGCQAKLILISIVKISRNKTRTSLKVIEGLLAEPHSLRRVPNSQ